MDARTKDAHDRMENEINELLLCRADHLKTKGRKLDNISRIETDLKEIELELKVIDGEVRGLKKGQKNLLPIPIVQPANQ